MRGRAREYEIIADGLSRQAQAGLAALYPDLPQKGGLILGSSQLLCGVPRDRAHPVNCMAAPWVPAAITVDLVRCRVVQRSQEAGMAQKVTVELEDDLDGGPADETVRFGVDGSEYEIDLSKKNAAAFRRKLVPFIDHARKAGRGARRRPGRTASSRERSADIRAWAKDQDIAVSERGRIPASVVEQYEAATRRP
jgi:hypothetical protein